ncbi:MAG: PEGA domain-containing protein [Myxococcota bacterium]|nr:PEGA domain-containing protein [Myxococcota bacterium]
MRHPRLLAVVIAVLCGATPRAAEAAPLTYVLWETSGFGIEQETAQLIHEFLRTELRRTLGDHLITEARGLDDETRSRVNRCGATTACLGEAGAALGANRVIVGTVSLLGDAYSLTLKVVNTRTLKEDKRATTNLSGERAKMLEAMQKLIFEVVDTSQLTGTLLVDVGIEGASVWIDSREVGTTPLPRGVEGLSAGEHVLKLTSPLIKDYFTFFQIQPGKTTRVSVDTVQVAALQAELHAAEEMVRVPLYKRWWFWTAVAGLGAAAATTYVLTHQSDGGAPSTSLGDWDMRAQ